MKDYDYATSNYYFVTVCTCDKQCIFGMTGKLTQWGKIAEQGILCITEHYPDVIVDQYVVMPNHIHAILYLKGGKINLSRVIGSYKSYVSKKIHETEPDKTIWQTSFHDHIIRNENAYRKIWQYIESNPVNWEKDCFYSG